MTHTWFVGDVTVYKLALTRLKLNDPEYACKCQRTSLERQRCSFIHWQLSLINIAHPLRLFDRD